MELPSPGDLFSGRYRIESVLGEGGFATVYRAVDTTNRQPLALKVLAPDDGRGYAVATRARLRREVEILQRLRHPNIVQQLAYGESPSGLLFVTFELLAGRDLDAVLDEAGRLSPAFTVSVMRQVLLALQTTHREGLLHRDLKPQNIRVIRHHDATTSVKLMDFGIARGSDSGHPSITKTGVLIGTPRYMSPEQLRGNPLGPSSDIYSLGLIAFELLMGAAALAGNTIFDQIERMGATEGLRVSGLENVNPGLLVIIQRMTRPAPQERFQSAHAVLAALDEVASGHTGITQSVSLDPTAREHPVVSSNIQPARESRSAWLVAIGAALGGFVLVGLFMGDTANPAPQKPPPLAPSSQALRPNGETQHPPPAPDADVPSPPAPVEPAKGDGCDEASGGERGIVELNRSLAVYVPRGYSPGVAHPLVVVANDTRSPPTTLLSDEAGLTRMADNHGVLLLSTSDIGLDEIEGNGRWGSVRDLKMIREQFRFVKQEFCVDTSRVFAVSHGRGGRALVRLACEDWIRGVAMKSWSLRRNSGDDGSEPLDVDSLREEAVFCDKPVPGILYWARDSKLVPYTGGTSCAHSRIMLSKDEVDGIWMQRNSVDAGPQTVTLPNGDVCQTWSGKAPFRSCLLRGGYPWPGTTWSGTGGGLCALEAGAETPPDFPLAEDAWKFFAALPP